MKETSFDVSISDGKKIDQIVVRAAGLLGDDTIGSRLDLSMDLTACHANGCPLDLDALLQAERYDFVHDVAGIARHIDRTTGTLRNCFSPRYAVRVDYHSQAGSDGNPASQGLRHRGCLFGF